MKAFVLQYDVKIAYCCNKIIWMIFINRLIMSVSLLTNDYSNVVNTFLMTIKKCRTDHNRQKQTRGI